MHGERSLPSPYRGYTWNFLGAFQRLENISDALDPTPGFAYLTGGSANLPSGSGGTAFRACFSTKRFPTNLDIYVYGYEDGYKGIWYTHYVSGSGDPVEWQRIDNYGTSSLSELASALGGSYKNAPILTYSEFDSMTNPVGVYFIQSGIPPFTNGSGCIIVIWYNQSSNIQIAVRKPDLPNHTGLAFRANWGGVMTSWYKVGVEEV